MVPPRHIPPPPSEPAWDIAFTRLAHAMQPQVDTCVLDLTRRFQAMGFGCERQVRQTPRGLSTLLAVVGQRGLLFIVDITLIDGMAVNEGHCAALDIRLLDACGDVVADSLAQGLQAFKGPEPTGAQWAMPEGLARAATSIYVAALGHFELSHFRTR